MASTEISSLLSTASDFTSSSSSNTVLLSSPSQALVLSSLIGSIGHERPPLSSISKAHHSDSPFLTFEPSNIDLSTTAEKTSGSAFLGSSTLTTAKTSSSAFLDSGIASSSAFSPSSLPTGASNGSSTTSLLAREPGIIALVVILPIATGIIACVLLLRRGRWRRIFVKKRAGPGGLAAAGNDEQAEPAAFPITHRLPMDNANGQPLSIPSEYATNFDDQEAAEIETQPINHNQDSGYPSKELQISQIGAPNPSQPSLRPADSEWLSDNGTLNDGEYQITTRGTFDHPPANNYAEGAAPGSIREDISLILREMSDLRAQVAGLSMRQVQLGHGLPTSFPIYGRETGSEEVSLAPPTYHEE